MSIEQANEMAEVAKQREELRDGIAHGTVKLPYPWCIGAPEKVDCAVRGFCRRNPNCGE